MMKKSLKLHCLGPEDLLKNADIQYVRAATFVVKTMAYFACH